MQPAEVAAIVDREVAAGHFAGAGLVVMRGEDVLVRHFAGDAGPGLPAGPEVL
jgi:hypothetical protein